MKIAVTGGNGELGSNLIPFLIEQGHQVVSMDRAPPANPLSGAEYLVVDMRDYRSVVAGLSSCDALVHLAAHRSPLKEPDWIVYNDNTSSSYNVLSAAATLGIARVCLASSVNAMGGGYSRVPRYDFFPLDEQHPTYVEDPYGLSKLVLELQGDAFARRHAAMRIASLRFHWLVESRERAIDLLARSGPAAASNLWSYTLIREASRACMLALTADFSGHQVFYIVAPHTAAATPSFDLARKHYPTTDIRGDLIGHAAFYSNAKAERILGWKHEE